MNRSRSEAFGRTVPKICEEAGLGHWPIHELRHSCASLLIAKEVEARRLVLLEQENSRLKRIVGEQALDISMLKDLNKGKW